jgi:arylsulfatase A-like enzyme
MPRCNILYLHSHDTGRYIQPYGHAIATPNLQTLAEQGVLFRQAFCAGPTCSPSRAALFTGQAPHSNGMIGLAHRGFRLNNYAQTLVPFLRIYGYFTALCGVQHIAHYKEAWKTIGYDAQLAEPAHAHDAAGEFLRTAPRAPFFLDVGVIETHREFPEAHPQDDPRYCLPPAPLPDTPATREDMARFKAMARALDSKIGRVLAALDETGLADNTLVICTTDHGIAFPRMKCNLHDSGIGVLLIMRGPGGFVGGKVVDAMASHIDIFPTLCALLDVAPPPWLQGASLVPLVADRAAAVHDEIFSEVTYHAAYEPMRCVRTTRHKYIRRFGDKRTPVLPNCDDGFSKSLWLEHGWRDRTLPQEELYDLIFDPNETNNLADAAACASTLQDLRARLERWMRATDDPLLRGPVPAPPGARVNHSDGLSPREEPQPV